MNQDNIWQSGIYDTVNPIQLQERIFRLQEQLEAFKKIALAVTSNESDDRVVKIICTQITQLMRADRTTLFIVKHIDDDEQILETTIAQNIRSKFTVKFGQGIAGWVAQHREPLNIKDVYKDRRFDPSFDKQNNYKTTSCLCAPIFIRQELIGVLQVINKLNGYFTLDDEETLASICSQIGVSISQYKSYLDLTYKNAKLLQTQEELQKANLELQQRNKEKTLIKIGQMMSSLLHDMKTPLANISGYADLLAQDGIPQKSRDVAIDSVERNIDRIKVMINEILQFARGDKLLLIRETTFHAILTTSMDMLRPEAERRNINLVCNEAYPGKFACDELKIQRAIENLVKNAMEAIETDGNIVISTSEDEQHIYLKVEDDGPGIPPEIRENLFDAFVTHGKRDGSGLGLAFVQKTVDEHEAKITCQPVTPHGTAFIITFNKQPQ